MFACAVTEAELGLFAVVCGCVRLCVCAFVCVCVCARADRRRVGWPQALYDFFYLPIDFKNKCNLGYAFINFRDPRCISAFFRDFADKRWERFNSEKVCVVTYARIQVSYPTQPSHAMLCLDRGF